MTEDPGKQVPIGSCPDSFGASEITLDEAWVPEPRWVVVEQDQFLAARDRPESVVAAQRRNMAFLSGLGLRGARPAQLEG